MTENNKDCDLCGLAVEIQGFELKTIEGNKRFCCEGCKGIYQMLHKQILLSEEQEKPHDN